jgi:hypothetical protein
MKANKVVTKPQARSNCDVTSFQSDMGTDGQMDQQTDQPTNIVSYRGATLRLEIYCKRLNQNGFVTFLFGYSHNLIQE